MTWFRNTVALAVGAALLLTPQLLPASAEQGHTVQAAAPTKVVVNQLIQGVVVDQFGRAVDDVDVFAARPGGNRVATAKTYASIWSDGPQHGYFYLPLDAAGRGTYVLTLSKSGYRPVELGRYDISRRKQRISLGEVEIQKVLAATETTAAVARRVITTRDRAGVAVTVTSRSTGKPVGTVEVREGKNVVGTATLKANARGSVTVSLAKLARGSHTLNAYFLGSKDLAPSSTKRPITLVIAKPRR